MSDFFSGFEMPQLFHPLRNTGNILGFAQIVKEATSGDTRYIFSIKLQRVCYGLFFTKQDDNFHVPFDHFCSKWHFLIQQGGMPLWPKTLNLVSNCILFFWTL
jgi:hypothetical protein